MKSSYREIFEGVSKGALNHGEITIENSIHGTEYEVYDLFLEFSDIYIIGEKNLVNKDGSHDRCIIISKKQITPEKADKSSMMFVVSHKPGSLYRALSVFENYALNLTKIESRRVYDKSYKYIFYVDFEYIRDHVKKLDEIIAVYKENTSYLRIIGFYVSN